MSSFLSSDLTGETAMVTGASRGGGQVPDEVARLI